MGAAATITLPPPASGAPQGACLTRWPNDLQPISRIDCLKQKYLLDGSTVTGLTYEGRRQKKLRAYRQMEMIMKYSVVAIFALVSFSSAAWARTETGSWQPSRAEIARADAVTMSINNLATGYVRNANNCAPFQARAIWSQQQVLLGYACYDNPN